MVYLYSFGGFLFTPTPPGKQANGPAIPIAPATGLKPKEEGRLFLIHEMNLVAIQLNLVAIQLRPAAGQTIFE